VGCPSDSHWSGDSPGGTGYIDYWFNGNLSGVRPSALTSPGNTLLQGDGDDGVDISDATYNKKSLPQNWLTDRSSPAWRHLGGANYLFTDGHVTWLKPHQVTTYGGRKNAFAVR
jgi:prepilin-type processing-associated H-X9-DG protein